MDSRSMDKRAPILDSLNPLGTKMPPDAHKKRDHNNGLRLKTKTDMPFSIERFLSSICSTSLVLFSFLITHVLAQYKKSGVYSINSTGEESSAIFINHL